MRTLEQIEKDIEKWEERQHTANMNPRNCFFIGVGKEADWRLRELRAERRNFQTKYRQE